MKNLNAIRPSPQELNESIRKPAQILDIKPARVMIEPKFDGSFIYITTDAVTKETVLCTKDGNQLQLEPAVQEAIVDHFSKYQDMLFEVELEPMPWSEESKVKLNGNLYSGAELPFSIRVAVHDALPLAEVNQGKTKAWDRYKNLLSLMGVSPDATSEVNPESPKLHPHFWARYGKTSIVITPCRLVTKEQAAQIFEKGWQKGQAQKRVMIEGEPYEGTVLIDPDSVHKGGRSNKWKVKPFHTVDVKVTSFSSKDTGKVITYEVQGEDIKSGEKIRVCTGISPEFYKEVKEAKSKYEQVIVEVEALAIKNLAHGNPTLKNIRYDKMTPLQKAELGMEID